MFSLQVILIINFSKIELQSLFSRFSLQYSRDGNLEGIKEIFEENFYRALSQINLLDENKVSGTK